MSESESGKPTPASPGPVEPSSPPVRSEPAEMTVKLIEQVEARVKFGESIGVNPRPDTPMPVSVAPAPTPVASAPAEATPADSGGNSASDGAAEE